VAVGLDDRCRVDDGHEAGLAARDNLIYDGECLALGQVIDFHAGYIRASAG
jgi:hypothetical protein